MSQIQIGSNDPEKQKENNVNIENSELGKIDIENIQDQEIEVRRQRNIAEVQGKSSVIIGIKAKNEIKTVEIPIVNETPYYHVEPELCYKLPCSDILPIQYHNRESLQGHIKNCKVCKIAANITRSRIGNMQEVATCFELGITDMSNGRGFRSYQNVLYYHNQIFAMRTKDDKLIYNTQISAPISPGFSFPRIKCDLSMPLTTVQNIFEVIDAENMIPYFEIVDVQNSFVLFNRIMEFGYHKPYLYGIDEGQPFIVELYDIPKIGSVVQALESLKPQEVKIAERLRLDVKRQGDLFFIHCPTIKDSDFSENIQKARYVNEIDTNYDYTTGKETETITRKKVTPRIMNLNHLAQNMVENNNLVFVKGYIRHANSEHTKLVLDNGWYQVVKNTAITSYNASKNAARDFD